MTTKNTFLAIAAVFVTLFLANCKTGKNMSNLDTSTVQQFDLEKYLGTWYEIARFDHRFERGLVGVTATYEKRADGKIKVLNQGYKNSFDGKLKTASGKAKTTANPGHLKVSFFWFFYTDYFVMELGENYEWALVGSSSDDYLWILSRTPQLEEKVKNHILGKAAQRGYSISKLIWVEQKNG